MTIVLLVSAMQGMLREHRPPVSVSSVEKVMKKVAGRVLKAPFAPLDFKCVAEG